MVSAVMKYPVNVSDKFLDYNGLGTEVPRFEPAHLSYHYQQRGSC